MPTKDVAKAFRQSERTIRRHIEAARRLAHSGGSSRQRPRDYRSLVCLPFRPGPHYRHSWRLTLGQPCHPLPCT
jgi:hypothetical protein